jgi:hypothetical protein
MAKTNFVTEIAEGPDMEARLKELDLDLDGVTSVIKQGEYARMEATDNDPQNAAGQDAYRYRVRGLRDVYRPTGKWDKAVDNGLELLISTDGKRRIITRAGDSGVGVRGAVPQPKQQVGETTVRAAKVNAQLVLDASWLNVEPAEKPDMETWMLLVFRSGDTVRSELSLPSGLDKDERALGWIERILLPALDLAESAPAKPEDGSGGGEPDPIHVPVSRKR